MLFLPKDSRCSCQSNSYLLVSFRLTICNAMQARQCLKKVKVDKNFKKPKVTTNYCNGILNFELGMMLKVKFSRIYSIWYSNTWCQNCEVVQKMLCNNML